MKKILSLLLVSVLGGIISLSAYKLFIEDSQKLVLTTSEANPTFLPTSANNSGVYNVYENPDFAMAAENSINTVVHVKNLAISSGQMTFEDLFLGRRSDRAQVGSGSGVIISPDGYIITNNHVINNSQELSITLNNNRTYTPKIIGSDSKTDIALLKIDVDEDLPYATFGDSDQAKIGEWVLAVGNPFNLTSTVTAGIISAKARDLSGVSSQSFIQTDAAVNPGNSGGALVNTKGELIGINTAITSQTGSYIGYSFAVPSNIAKRVVEDIIEYGNVQNGILGIEGGALNSNFAEEKGINDTQGIYISSIIEDSGAEQAGIKEGDIIKEIDNIKVTKFSDLTGHISAKRVNDVVDLTILRDGDLKAVRVTLTKKNTLAIPFVGDVKDAKPEDLRKSKASNGVKIIKLSERYADDWIKNGVKEGSIITAINEEKINSVDDVKKILDNRSRREPLKIELINTNGEKERYYFR